MHAVQEGMQPKANTSWSIATQVYYFKGSCVDVTLNCVENVWKNLKDFLSGVDKVFGKAKSGRVRRNEIWWWNNAVNDVVKEKRHK